MIHPASQTEIARASDSARRASVSTQPGRRSGGRSVLAIALVHTALPKTLEPAPPRVLSVVLARRHVHLLAGTIQAADPM